ncbi:IS66 family transposase [bacterium]|nr:IS66 family transposase [bacterium]
MNEPVANLPETTAECHVLIRALAEENEKRCEANAALSEENERHEAMIAALAHDIEQYRQRVDWLTRRLFGRKSEKFDPARLDFFGEPYAQDESPEEQIPEPETKMPPLAPRKGHGRKPLPENLPRERREYDIPEEEKVCPDCGEMKTRIGEEVTEQLEYIPASLFVIEHVRLKYACKHCQGQVSLAEKPAQPIEKGLPGPGLLAHVVTSKYSDHLPLNRQESILARHGVEIPRSTTCDWMMGAATLLEPVVRGMQKEILKSAVIHTDDTPLPVQQKGKTHRAYLWVYLGDADHPYTLYDFTWTRGREGPEKILEHYEGYLQADAFSGYDNLYAKKPIVEVGCWAHARRHFYDARETDPVRAHDALLRIKAMYKIESDARELDAESRCALRREKTVLRLEAFETWLKENASRVLPKSPIGKAIAYAQNHWTALNRFTQDGNLEIDNNSAERAIRPLCVGRNNWLFAGSERGGHAAAILYSLVQSAKRHALDPFRYLRDLLEIIPTLSHKQIPLLFPDKWKALQAAQTANGPSPDSEPAPASQSLPA